MTVEEKNSLEAIVLKLLAKKPKIGLHDVAEAAGIHEVNETDRKSIRRLLQVLVGRGVLEFSGTTRDRVYFLKRPSTPTIYKTIPISENSKQLLDYLERPLSARTPVGYNRNFLTSYEPGRTEFLSKDDRASLWAIGRSENTTRPAGTYARNVLNRLLIDLSWNSSRLEGNTYSLLETKRLIEQGKSVDGKDAAEAQMILNHKRAIEYIVDSCDEPEITTRTIYSIHTLLAFNLLPNPRGYGRIREFSVGVTGTSYLPLGNPHLIREYFELFVQKLNLIQDPFEQSVFSMVHLSYLQAFEDVNKRTGRLVSNIPLIKKNLRPLSFTEVDREIYVQSLLGIYEKNDVSLMKDLYLWAYKTSAQQYSAIQQTMSEQNLLRLKYHHEIQNIIRTVIFEKTSAEGLVPKIRKLIEALSFPKAASVDLFKIIEIEIESLHDGNIAGYEIKPSEFETWKNFQSH